MFAERDSDLKELHENLDELLKDFSGVAGSPSSFGVLFSETFGLDLGLFWPMHNFLQHSQLLLT